MNSINILQTAIWTILFVIPGYIASGVKHYWMLTLPKLTAEKSLESIGWSFAIYYILLLLPNKIFDMGSFVSLISENISIPEKLLFHNDFLTSYITIMVVSAILGFLYGYFFPTGLMSKVFSRTPPARVWDEFFFLNKKEATNYGLWIDMKDGSKWVGKLRAATDSPGARELWLTDIRVVEGDCLCKTSHTEMLIDHDNICRIFVMKDWNEIMKGKD